MATKNAGNGDRQPSRRIPNAGRRRMQGCGSLADIADHSPRKEQKDDHKTECSLGEPIAREPEEQAGEDRRERRNPRANQL